jgi:hypothetical protein
LCNRTAAHAAPRQQNRMRRQQCRSSNRNCRRRNAPPATRRWRWTSPHGLGRPWCAPRCRLPTQRRRCRLRRRAPCSRRCRGVLLVLSIAYSTRHAVLGRCQTVGRCHCCGAVTAQKVFHCCGSMSGDSSARSANGDLMSLSLAAALQRWRMRRRQCRQPWSSRPSWRRRACGRWRRTPRRSRASRQPPPSAGRRGGGRLPQQGRRTAQMRRRRACPSSSLSRPSYRPSSRRRRALLRCSFGISWRCRWLAVLYLAWLHCCSAPPQCANRTKLRQLSSSCICIAEKMTTKPYSCDPPWIRCHATYTGEWSCFRAA